LLTYWFDVGIIWKCYDWKIWWWKHPIVDSGVWIKTDGENRKGRIYGFGHSLDLGIDPHVSSSTVERPSSQNLNPTTEEITTLTTQISNLQEQVKTQLQALMQAQMKAQVEMQATMQQQMQEQCNLLRENYCLLWRNKNEDMS